MILRWLRVENFGCLGSGRWEFAPGVNLVRGPNEAGKSTLAEAIAKALLGDAPATTTADEYERWITWGRQEMFVLEAEFEHGGEVWRVLRDFAEGREQLENLSSGERIRGKVRDRLAEMVGLTGGRSERQYLATAHLKQGEWAALADDKTMQELIARVALAGGAAQPTKVLRELRKRHSDWARGMKKDAPKNPGPVAVARKRVAEIQEKLKRADGLEQQAKLEEQAREELAEAEQRLAEVRRELDELRPKIEAAQKRRQLEEQRARAQERIDELSERIARAEELAGRIREAQAELEALPEIEAEEVSAMEQRLQQAAELRQQGEAAAERAEEHRRQVQALRDRLTELGAAPAEEDVAEAARLDQQHRELEQRAAEIQARAQGRRQAAGARVVAGLAAAAAGVVALVLAAVLPVAFVVRVVLAILGAGGVGAGAIVAALARKQAAQAEMQQVEELRRQAEIARARLREILGRWGCSSAAELAQKRAALVTKRAELEQELAKHEQAAKNYDETARQAGREAEAIEQAAADRLSVWGVADLDEAKEKAARRRHAQERRSQAEAALAQVLGNETLDDLRRELVKAEAERARLDEQLGQPEMLAAAMDDQEFGAEQLRLQQLEQEERALLEKQAEARGTLNANRGAAQRLVVAKQELVAAQKAAEHAEHYERVLAAAVEVLEQAIREVEASAHELILPTAGELLRRLTAGRYQRVAIGQRRAMVEVPERAGPVEDELLSYATREQVYLALRLAMYLTLWPDEGPPLILDEPLLAFDEQRTQAALEVIREAAKGRQVIILSATDEYDGIADHVIELAAPW